MGGMGVLTLMPLMKAYRFPPVQSKVGKSLFAEKVADTDTSVQIDNDFMGALVQFAIAKGEPIVQSASN